MSDLEYAREIMHLRWADYDRDVHDALVKEYVRIKNEATERGEWPDERF